MEDKEKTPMIIKIDFPVGNTEHDVVELSKKLDEKLKDQFDIQSIDLTIRLY